MAAAGALADAGKVPALAAAAAAGARAVVVRLDALGADGKAALAVAEAAHKAHPELACRALKGECVGYARLYA
jgi:hypothetical protein